MTTPHHDEWAMEGEEFFNCPSYGCGHIEADEDRMDIHVQIMHDLREEILDIAFGDADGPCDHCGGKGGWSSARVAYQWDGCPSCNPSLAS